MDISISTLLPLTSVPTPTLAPTTLATPAIEWPTDFAALMTQARLAVPGEQAPATTAVPHPAPALPPTLTTPDSDTQRPDPTPVDEQVTLSPDTLALMASLPGMAPPAPQHNVARAGEQRAPAMPALPATEMPPPAPAPVPATPHTTAGLPATPTLTDAVQHQAEQVEAPMISAPREMATPINSATPTPASAPPPATSSSLPAPLNSPQWPQEFSQQLVQFSRGLRGGEQRVEMHLNPAHLGPLSVSLTLDEQGAQAQFFSAHAPVRTAVEQAIPQLREALAEQGITLGDAMVGEHRQPPGEQHASHGGQGRASGMAPASDMPVDTAPATQPITVHGVDLYA
ncbi:flagellar hook-length control protein FliK [Isoalcanivorax pacificus W11-5]|uniref:Flagellar hook-length control protein FliK n=1 Tax=Isoalcanivorax pacificus W11-5 TaxID=391936 RepID=A0A0B4XQ64_9GAMM|nr:flagellar hook-length control protein FliK [Isoalcanivorax pacificus]AJD49356.1 flagellar hook-length control protein FliK [Isoalcanivorax pacificus W11-5]